MSHRLHKKTLIFADFISNYEKRGKHENERNLKGVLRLIPSAFCESLYQSQNQCVELD